MSWTECLLFVAYKEKMPLSLDVSRLQRSQIEVYGLLPLVGNHDFIRGIFTRRGIKDLIGPPFDAFLIESLKSERVELIELSLKKNEESPNSNPTVKVGVFTADIIRLILGDGSFYEEWSHSPGTAIDEKQLTSVGELASFWANIRYRSGNMGGTILHYSVFTNQESLVLVLLDTGAWIDARTLDGQTSLHLAIQGSKMSFSIPELLVKRGATVNATITGGELAGATPLHLAMKRPVNSDRLVAFLLDNGASVEADSQLGNVLQLAAIRDTSTEKQLLATVLRWSPDLSSSKNQEALRMVLKQKDDLSIKKTVSMLVNYGFRLTPADAKNVDLLRGHVVQIHEIMSDLLQWGAGVHYRTAARMHNETGEVVQDLFHRAIQSNYDTYEIRFLLQLQGTCPVSELHHLFQMIIKDDSRLSNSSRWSFAVNAMLESSDLCLNFTSNPNLFELLNVSGFKNVIVKHVLLVTALDLSCNESFSQDQLPPWVQEVKISPELQEYKAQVVKLKSEKIAESNFTFYDILNKKLPQLVRFLRNKSAVEALKIEDYIQKFPAYPCIISCRFQNANYRRTLLDKGMKMFNFLFKQSPIKNLSFSLKEDVLDHLSNVDLLVLVNICKLPDDKPEEQF